jgi:hypothetical protein
MILKDIRPETSKAIREDEPIASLATTYFTQQKSKWPSRGTFTGTQTRSPTKKDSAASARDREQSLQRLPTLVWDEMNKEAREEYLQEKRRR